MKRRKFIVLGGAAGSSISWPLSVRAQQHERVRRIGVIMGFAEDDQVWQSYLATFRRRLQDFGWSEGRNIRFDYRFTGENTESMRLQPQKWSRWHRCDLRLHQSGRIG
jgi:putative ABC transport system substrate-binding protein